MILSPQVEHHAWPIPETLGPWQNLVVIPCRNECDDFISSFDSFFRIKSPPYLVVLVVNSPVDAPSSEFVTNQKLLNFLKSQGEELRLDKQFSIFKFGNFDIYVADFGTQISFAFPEKQGVGLARKLGSDFATYLFQLEKLQTHWISSTDADALLPEDYFFSKTKEHCSYHYPYEHQVSKNPEIQQAIEIYEIYLRLHRLGLEYARSPYAYPSIGSCLRFSLKSYVQTRGFSKVLAGEDFYLLNKLAKCSHIKWSPSSPIIIKPRSTVRTPFGTSASVKKISEAPEDYKIYNPEVYEALRKLLRLLEDYSETLNLDELCLQLERADLLRSFSAGLSLEKLHSFLSQFKDAGKRRRHLHEHFDAWKTLKWIHIYSDQSCPRLPWDEALRSSRFLDSRALSAGVSCLKALRDQDHKTALASPWSLR